MQIVGISSSIGEFNGIQYNNLVFHCQHEFAKKDSYGYEVEKISLKLADCAEALSLVGGDVSALVGCDAEFFYNRYGKATKINILEVE